MYRFGPIIAIVGHVLQLVSTFGFLLMPDYEASEDENDSEVEEDDYWRKE